MATMPFSDELVTKLKGATGWRFNSELGPVFTPRFFCCDDPNDLGITDGKEPVAVLELSPNPCLVGDTVSFDGRDSYDPDGSIASYAWTFESGTPASSALSNGTVSWAAAGEYVVTLVVTDGTGKKSSPARVIMVVREPEHSYFIGADDGVWYTASGGQSWASRSSGLLGYDLIVNDLKIDPATQHLADDDKTIWAATDGGLYVSIDGGQNWVEKNPASVENNWADSPAPTVAELTFKRLLFSNEGRLFASANWLNGSGDERSWLFYTDEAGLVRTDINESIDWSEI